MVNSPEHALDFTCSSLISQRKITRHGASECSTRSRDPVLSLEPSKAGDCKLRNAAKPLLRSIPMR